MRNRPFMMGVLTACCCVSLVVGGVVAYAASGTPEINNANATMALHGTWQSVNCVGEDAKNYRTYVSPSWGGIETQNANDATDHSLTAVVGLTGIQWTINTVTLRGVLTSAITATNPTLGVGVYTGRLTLVTQGLPGTTLPPTVYGRGWIQARLSQPDETVTAGDDFLIANVEFRLGLNVMNGQFGNLSGSLAVPDYSVVTNVAPTASDGLC